MPALKCYEKDHNILAFRDRMRGYLGLPRRRKTFGKHRMHLFLTIIDSGNVKLTLEGK